ncbi:hypothetical protein AAG906_022375 [Vitis piasezkii]
MRGSACVEVMTTLHGSAPSLRRRAEGCVPLGGAEEEYFQDQDFYSQSGYSFVDQSKGQISSFRYTDMDQQPSSLSISSRPPWLLSKRLWLASSGDWWSQVPQVSPYVLHGHSRSLHRSRPSHDR